MFRRKFIRTGSALLMILALSLPAFTPSAFAGHAVTAVETTTGGGLATALGADEGGTSIRIIGTAFSIVPPAPQVTVGGALATNVVVSSATLITATTPLGTLGAQIVCVNDNGGVPADDVCLAAGFTYTELTVVGVPAPPSGAPGAAVTISGTGFNQTPSVGAFLPSVVTFGGVAGTGTTTNGPGTAITSTVPAGAPTGTIAACVAGGGETACTTFVNTGPTLTVTPTTTTTPTTVPTPVGGVAVTGTVNGVTPAPGPRGSVNVVMVNQSTGAAFGVKTSTVVATLGTFTLVVPPGTYRLSIADNDGGQTGCIPGSSAPCGHLINQQIVTVGAGGLSLGTITLTAKSVTNALPTTGCGLSPFTTACTGGIAGEARDATTGNALSGAVVNAVSVPAATSHSTTVGADGRFFLGVEFGTYNVTLVPTTGVCTAGPITDLCTDNLGMVTGTMADPSFLVVAGGALPTVSPSQLGSGVLQGIIPMIFRDTDTSRTGGVDIETDTIRVLNGGVQRTVACVDFFGSDSDGRRTTQERQCLDLNPQAAGVFSGDIVPSGLMGFAEVYSIDLDGAPAAGIFCPGTTFIGTLTPTTTAGAIVTGCLYGNGDLHTVVTHRVADADNALAGTNGLTCEDVLGTVANCGINAGTTGVVTQQTTLNVNQNMVLPVVMKNYGGTPDKWDTVVNACQASGVPARQPVVFEFWSVNAPGAPGYSNPWLYNRTADPGGCITFNLRDLDFLENGPYALNVTSTGLVGPAVITAGGTLARPNTFTLAAINFSRTGRAATAHNGYAPATGGATTSTCSATATPPFTGICSSKLYGPLIFSDYATGGGSWWSGIAFSNFPATGTGGSTAITLTVIDEAGVTRGVINDRPGGDSTTTFWLGVQPGTENRGVWLRGRLVIPLDRNFRGSFIADAADVTGNLESRSRRPFAMVHHTNYARRAYISYNAVREESLNPTQFGQPAQATDTRPCSMQINSQLNSPTGVGNPAPIGSTCIWVPEVLGAVPQIVRAGSATGIRLFNPGSVVVTVDVLYFDAAGIEWTDSRTTFSIGPFSTATIFTGTDFRLPPNFSGSVYMMAACSTPGQTTCAAPVAGIANIVNYAETTRDASRAMNLPSQTGFTQ